MNVDDFLDQIPASEDPDVNISQQEVIEQDQSYSMNIPNRDIADKIPNNLSNNSTEILLEKNTVQKPSTPQQSENVSFAKKTIADVVKAHIADIQYALKNKDITGAQAALAEIIKISQTIHVPAARIKLNKEIARLHSLIHHQVTHYKRDFLKNAHAIRSFMQQSISSLDRSDVISAENYFIQAQKIYNTLSDEFSELKHDIYVALLRLNSKITSAKKGEVQASFESNRDKINRLLSDAQWNIKQQKYDVALDRYRRANRLFSQLPQGFLEEKMVINSSLVKIKNAIDLLIQISNLNKELVKAGVRVPDVVSTEPEVLEKHVGHLTERANKYSSSDKEEVNIDEYNYVPDVKLKERVKESRLGQIKLDLMNGRYDQAKKGMESLYEMFPNDYEIADLYTHLQRRLMLLDPNLADPQPVISKKFREDDSIDLPSKTFEDLRQKMISKNKKSSHAAVNRRVLLAEKQIARGSFEKARVNLRRALELDPTHSEAIRLYNLIK